MSATGAPPNWYPDPSGGEGLRWWDGRAWSEHVAVQPVFVPMPLPWKGYQIGRPASGPGSLADPGIRVAAAWLIDAAVFFAVFAAMLTVVRLIAAPRFGPIFPQVPANDPDAKVPFPEFFWIYQCVFACAFVASLLMAACQTVATAVYVRSFGKKLLHVRPVRTSDLGGLGWAEPLGVPPSSGVPWPSAAGWARSCRPGACGTTNGWGVHGKAVDSIVIEELPPPPVLL